MSYGLACLSYCHHQIAMSAVKWALFRKFQRIYQTNYAINSPFDVQRTFQNVRDVPELGGRIAKSDLHKAEIYHR